mmetsp:Transcript_7440/g.11702  ORF Transcript_7440/g.11702 Transcript_7440/m.11702 type:complete len:104 (-) Transcript_7440:495-806(-)
MTTPVHPPLQTCHVTQAELAEHTLAGETVLSRRLDKLDASLFNAKAEQARSPTSSLDPDFRTPSLLSRAASPLSSFKIPCLMSRLAVFISEPTVTDSTSASRN